MLKTIVNKKNVGRNTMNEDDDDILFDGDKNVM